MPAYPGETAFDNGNSPGTMGCNNGHVGNKFHLESAADFYYFLLLIAE